MLHGLPIGGLSPIRTRDWTAAARGCGILGDRDLIPRTWLVHLGSAPLISYGRGEGRRAHLSPDTLSASSTAEYRLQRREYAIASKVSEAYSRGRIGNLLRLSVSAAAALLRRQKVGKQIARLASRKMAHVVGDGKGYRRKTR